MIRYTDGFAGALRGEPEFPGSPLKLPPPSFFPLLGTKRETSRDGETGSQGGTVMSKQKRRRKWSPAQKLRIVLESLQSDGKLATICRREGSVPQPGLSVA